MDKGRGQAGLGTIAAHSMMLHMCVTNATCTWLWTLGVKDSRVYASSSWLASTAGTVSAEDTGASTCIAAFLHHRSDAGRMANTRSKRQCPDPVCCGVTKSSSSVASPDGSSKCSTRLTPSRRGNKKVDTEALDVRPMLGWCPSVTLLMHVSDCESIPDFLP